MRRQAAVLGMLLALACPAWGQEVLPGPGADVLRDLLDRLGPALEGLRDRLGDLSRYEVPEVLPNGDILIRRKPSAPAPVPDPAPQAGPEGQIDL